ncbi:MAG: type II secretion system F family protein [Candidatus Omnitrophota bacterium]|nr:MAG: type II secretion system F family protein [Candidatus Omnitrophota bacterium]
MAIYLYKAKKGPSEIVEGTIEAQNQQEALSKIGSLGLFPIGIREKKGSLKKKGKGSLKDLVEFTHQLSTLINSGSTLISSLNTLSLETEQLHLKPIILDIIAQVKEGVHFSQALEKYPHIFSPLYISLVKTGETSGTLGQNLARIAQFLEEELDFRTNIVSILTYPCVIVAVGIITVLALLKFVIPKLVGIFEDIGQALPLPTLILKNISDLFSKYWIIVLGCAFLLFFAGRKYFRIPRNRMKWHEFKLRLPLVGELLRKIEITRLARTLAILLRNGVAIDTSLEVVTSTVSNVFFQAQIGKIEKEIKEGMSLNEAMRKLKVFPPAFINVVTVGEQSGSLDRVLENLSLDYNKEISRKMKNILSILEPILILGVGLMVGFIVLSMLLPIFQIDFNF